MPQHSTVRLTVECWGIRQNEVGCAAKRRCFSRADRPWCFVLPTLQQQTDRCASRDASREGYRDCFKGILLHSLLGVINKLRCRIAALLY